MSANVDIAHDTLFPGMLLQICAQLNILKHRFKVMLNTLQKIHIRDQIKQFETLKAIEKKLFADCVEHHVTILRLTDDVISIFSKMIFIQYSCSSIILCSSVYALSQMKPFSPEFIACAVYILCMFFQIFYICMSGNRVTLEFSELSAAMYDTNWYTLTNAGRKNMFIMMMRSLKPIVIASGHFVTLSLDSFKNLLKLSYTIYNVFQQSS
ncbi:odorant receptor Or1-like [Chelonus insularis]|uniref:odorant receptor Or1-like n=1 Tax=Chelonus insularis TaxID=460826 RepID=UPI0015894721|nr:odorant receptor Or1-like [Chelonus insularis]